MKILIRSYLSQPPFSGKGEIFERDTTREKCTITQLLEDMGVSIDEAGLFFVNKERVGKNHSLKEGDIVEIVPILAGGMKILTDQLKLY